MALGYMGMTEKEFGEMGVQTFFLKLFYFNKAKEANQKFIAEVERLQTVQLINIQLDPKNRFKTPQELFKYAWEEEKPVGKQDPEQLAKLVAKANKILNGNI